MEFTHGRDRFYINEQEEACKHAPFLPNSSPFFSFPSSSSVPVRWHGGCGRGNDCYIEKEHMFDKVVTPSDVGKLNRLVIPKQHAERYFPLMDSGASQNGLLLSFEDRNGESWRFRYSYWSSSQSYVMTKGWSRFVKEKRLDAGDTVSFGRGVGESGRDRLYIDWKRRPRNHEAPRMQRIPFTGVSFGPWGAHRFMPPLPQGYGHNASVPSATGGQLLFFQSPATPLPPIEVQPGGGGGGGLSMVLDSAPVVVHRKAMGRGLRLFGVNLVSPESEGDVGVGGEGASPSSSRSQETSALPLLQLQPGSLDSSVASSSSTSKEQYSSLALDL